jgi:hypothetical protein
LIQGKSPKNIQLLYIWSVFLFLTAVSIIAQVLYPTQFSILTHTISEQGSISKNPVGSIVWRIGVILNGFGHIPHIFYIHYHLKKLNPRKALIVKYLGIFAAIGFSFVGLVSLDYGMIHYVFAVIAFIGYFITAIITFTILNQDRLYFRHTSKQNSNISLFSNIFALYFKVSGIFCLGSFLINGVFLHKDVSPILEWNYLMAICIWLLAWPWIVKQIESKPKYKCDKEVLQIKK